MEWLETLLASNDIFTLQTITEYTKGLSNTLQLVLLSVALGLMLALPMALMRCSSRWWISQPVHLFTYVFRGTPLLIQLYIIYYGSSVALNDTIFWVIFREAFFPALLAFTLNTAAYTAEILRGAIVATPAGEVEAAKAYGMNYWKRMRCVVLPNAFRRALPAYTNEVIFMLHASAVAFTVTIMDLTGAAYLIYSRFYAPFDAFIFVACIYFCLTFTIITFFRKVEFNMLAHLRPRVAD